ncbi:hypothetical protein [Bacillus sp. NPDC094106]|uniref:hypothetical protein n=1 Tax=Bacillus sp. NPDC094106 TaxID=3363949 RepID=UPI0037F7B3CD
MPLFQRKNLVNAIQFKSVKFHNHDSSYPEVWDRAMFSENWSNKTAKDGRYYIVKQPSTNIGGCEYETVNDGDYLIREEMGVIHVVAKEIFEKNYELVSE